MAELTDEQKAAAAKAEAEKKAAAEAAKAKAEADKKAAAEKKAAEDAAKSKAKYVAEGTVIHDGKTYEHGAAVDVSGDDAKRLVELGAVKKD